MANYKVGQFIKPVSTGDVSIKILNVLNRITHDIKPTTVSSLFVDKYKLMVKTLFQGDVITLDFDTTLDASTALLELKAALELIKKQTVDTSQFQEFRFDIPSYTWNVDHNLVGKPTVTAVDDSFNEIDGMVKYIDNATIQVLFNQEVTGWVFLG